MGEAVRAVLEVVEGTVVVSSVGEARNVVMRLTDGDRVVIVMVVSIMVVRVMVLATMVCFAVVRMLVRLGRAPIVPSLPMCFVVLVPRPVMMVVRQPSMQGDVEPWTELHPEEPHQRCPDRERAPPGRSREHGASARAVTDHEAARSTAKLKLVQ